MAPGPREVAPGPRGWHPVHAGWHPVHAGWHPVQSSRPSRHPAFVDRARLIPSAATHASHPVDTGPGQHGAPSRRVLVHMGSGHHGALPAEPNGAPMNRTTRLSSFATVVLLLFAPSAAVAADGRLADTGSTFPIGLGIAGAIVLLGGIAAFVISKVRKRSE
ncbi:LPXTG cell wall anchor domain-containing protein [Pseudactinotalea sp. HY160]|nr:LPXTG cell wall anchor domain-containing protein [Pseudactinotalea sp. HY160]